MFKKLQFILALCFALAVALQGHSRAIPQGSSARQQEVDPDKPLLKHYDNTDYQGNAWMVRTSRPFTIQRGLQNRHLSVWASHGRFYDGGKNKWIWQRPFMFCTTEDLLTQSFVYPFLIPMLENAGAVVFTPRERDYQSQEAIVDNDTPSRYGTYAEQGQWRTAAVADSVVPGFGLNYPVLNDTVMPFRMGSARMIPANSEGSATWMPQIPEQGQYAVYVSYATLPNSVSDASYTVFHAGGKTTFRVNQRMGGGTWLYLGTFLFEEGQSERNRVVLSSASKESGVVTADAVRFGGGRGLVERSVPSVSYSYRQHNVQCADTLRGSNPADSARIAALLTAGQITAEQALGTIALLRDSLVTDTLTHYNYGPGQRSGLARYLEAARYYAQWAGLADTLMTRDHGTNDYNDDLRSRSYLLNRLAGGSCFLPDTIGAGVPIELQFALHTDAGFHRNHNIYGALTIATGHDDFGRTEYRTGLSREVSKEYAGKMLNNIGTELSRIYNVEWPQRELRVRNYSETRSPQVPSIILELLSHQNFRDMTFAHDPNFKFNVSRCIYKTLLREIYQLHSLGEPVIQPLPVKAMSAVLQNGNALITWQPQLDSLETSAVPTDYVVYVRQGSNDWDEGTLSQGRNALAVVLKPGVHYQFRVTAINAGGESFPSEPVSIYRPVEPSAQKILVVNAFDRVSGPARLENSDRMGFDLATDVGVSYGVNTSFSGQQKNFFPSAVGGEGPNSFGYSGAELTGVALAGNQFDGIAMHTADILAASPSTTVVSMSREAFDALSPTALKAYSAIDYVSGLQADLPYNIKHYDIFSDKTRQLLTAFSQAGGHLFVSGSYLGLPASSADAAAQSADSLFLAQTLHSLYRAQVAHGENGTFVGLGLDIPVYNRPSDVHYPCQVSSILEPADATTFSAFAYTDEGFSAGVAWPNSPACGSGVVMAFPYDCISDPNTRLTVMTAILNYLKD